MTWAGIALVASLAASYARAGALEEIEAAEAIFHTPWHVDTLTPDDREIDPPPVRIAFLEHGKASWYRYTGRRTANGEAFPSASEMTCAHPVLAFNTLVRVTRVDTGRSIRCRVNDRGPAKWTRKIIDLNPLAAVGLGIVKAGWVRVRVEVLR